MKFAASILLFAFLMAIRDEFENTYMRMLVAAAAGAALAPVMVDWKGRRPLAERAAPERRARGPLWIATFLYVVSWFLPVIQGGWTLDRGLPGWEAITTVLHPLWDSRAFSEEPWGSLLWVVSGLTNLFMLIALVRLHRMPATATTPWLWSALVATAINASWIAWDWADQALRIGYFCWFLSFVFLAVSLIARGQRKGLTGPQLSAS